jgi:hypothetical protein
MGIQEWKCRENLQTMHDNGGIGEGQTVGFKP